VSVLRQISAWLARQTPAFVAATAVFSYFVPETFGWVRGWAQTGVLGVIMLAMGMTLGPDDFRALAKRPFDLALGTLAQFMVMPFVAWGLVHALGLPRGVAVGLVLVGCCPGGVSSNIMSFLCKGDVAYSVGMTTLSTLLAPVVTPFMMLFLAGELVDVDAVGMFKSVLLVTIAPVAIGFLLNRFFGRRPGYAAALGVMPGLAVLGLACIVGGVVSAQAERILSTGALVAVGVFLHNGLGYVLGYAVGVVARFPRAKKRTIAIEVGMQNAGLATVLAVRHFPALPEAALASAVSCVWHSVSGALTAGLFNRIDAWTEKKGKTT